jgi:hypothetical protein
MESQNKTLEQYREEYIRSRFLATPLTGAVVWLAIAIASLFLEPILIVWTLFIGTGFYCNDFDSGLKIDRRKLHG